MITVAVAGIVAVMLAVQLKSDKKRRGDEKRAV